MPTTKTGNPRKSRRRRLAVAAYRGEPDASGQNQLEYSPTEAEWKSIEQAYGGVGFTLAQNGRLKKIVVEYFLKARLEMAAPFSDEASPYLKKAEESARTFVRALLPIESSARNAVFRVRDLIEMAAPSLDIVHLESLTKGFIAACERAKSDLEQQANASIEEGRAWSELILELTKFADDNGLPAGASKGLGKSKTGKPSPFVAFVCELQISFPKPYRRYNHSHQALARAIGEARKPEERRERISRHPPS